MHNAPAASTLQLPKPWLPSKTLVSASLPQRLSRLPSIRLHLSHAPTQSTRHVCIVRALIRAARTSLLADGQCINVGRCLGMFCLSSQFRSVHTSAAATVRHRRRCLNVLGQCGSLCRCWGAAELCHAAWGRSVGGFGWSLSSAIG